MNTRTSEPADLNNEALRSRAIAAARGDAPFDVLIIGGNVVDMVTSEIRAADIGLVGPLIASVHKPGQFKQAQQTIDASGKFITPGLIDTHLHVESSMVTPAIYAQTVVPRGVTTIVWDPHELGNVLGKDGVKWAVDATRNLPLRALVLAPSCVPAAPGLEISGADFDGSALADILSWPAIAGLAEVMNMRGVINRTSRMTHIMQAGLTSGKMVCGHARGLSGCDLQAFMTAGVSSDHELTSNEDLMEKLRAGIHVEMRGSHDHLLPGFVKTLNKLGFMPQTVSLCTDDVFPDDLVQKGGLDDVVRRLVSYGMPAIWALRAATLNAAMHLKRDDLGLIAAGRRGDIVLFDDLENFTASHVFANGKLVANNGDICETAPAKDPGILHNTMKIKALSADDFRIRASGNKVRLATIDQPRFTRWGEVEAPVKDGFVIPPKEATLIAVAHRHGKADSQPRVGLLTGWGQWRGAVCTSVSHDSHNLTVFGGNAEDMAVAANAVIAAGGGMAVASNGKIDALLPLPLCGLLTETSMQETAGQFAAIRAATDRIVDWNPPYLVFKALFGATLACNIGPHQTDRGIADVISDTVLETPVLEILS
ncbi:adenine deaminase [Thalassospira profundimaris]|uniref:Adenine deaminase n=1 Tax=Thalassospira profundimaris TaxID=502049 RepID=A0A367WJ99_9PROT|nr:adenine deaminase C-terminal domain-containing protein [Thalassospira profundimaris]RCK41497.1 adenine deaminase [Thalassospira profundimaris]